MLASSRYLIRNFSNEPGTIFAPSAVASASALINLF